jgi:protein TonB
MRQPIHAMSGGRRQMTPERLVGIGFVAVLHVIVIWAIVSGLVQKIVQAPPPGDITARFVPDKAPPPPPAPKMPDVNLPNVKPVETVQAPPPLDIRDDDQDHGKIIASLPPPQVLPLGPTVADQVVAGITATHTTPPYPPLARRLGEQGTVTLRLTISPQGVVTGADIVKSSGYADLDQSAMSWVMSHWKYKPAVRNGSPAASQTTAAVVFSLKNAG